MLAITIVVASIGSVAAYGGKFPGIDPQSRDKITNAIKANDYNAWKDAMSAQLTEDEFKILVQLHQAKQEGNYTKVRELSEQLGLPGGFGKHKIFGHFGIG